MMILIAGGLASCEQAVDENWLGQGAMNLMQLLINGG